MCGGQPHQDKAADGQNGCAYAHDADLLPKDDDSDKERSDRPYARPDRVGGAKWQRLHRSEEHTSELQSLMRISYAVFCLKKKKTKTHKYIVNKLLSLHQPPTHHHHTQ